MTFSAYSTFYIFYGGLRDHRQRACRPEPEFVKIYKFGLRARIFKRL
jgi:hypothetical protein